MGDVIFLLDAFKLLNNILEGKDEGDLQELIIECERLLNDAATGDEDDGLAEFRENIKNATWSKDEG